MRPQLPRRRPHTPASTTAPALAGDHSKAPCRCGHPQQWHEHYRAGNDCSTCSCRAYRRETRLRSAWIHFRAALMVMRLDEELADEVCDGGCEECRRWRL